MRTVAFVPARSGSQRVPGKNVRALAGHPLMAYSIAAARESGVFDRVIVSTDSEATREIALRYGAEAPFLRPAEIATSSSIDAEWISHAFEHLEPFDAFAILRPTSPFRSASTIRRAMDQFLSTPGIDSLRAVELCRDHPGKMWVVEGATMRPYIEQSGMKVAWHAMQYRDLPRIHVQNSSLEIASSRAILVHGTREGKVVAPFLTNEIEGFSIDYELDWDFAEYLLRAGKATLSAITAPLAQGGAR